MRRPSSKELREWKRKIKRTPFPDFYTLSVDYKLPSSTVGLGVNDQSIQSARKPQTLGTAQSSQHNIVSQQSTAVAASPSINVSELLARFGLQQTQTQPVHSNSFGNVADTILSLLRQQANVGPPPPPQPAPTLSEQLLSLLTPQANQIPQPTIANSIIHPSALSAFLSQIQSNNSRPVQAVSLSQPNSLVSNQALNHAILMQLQNADPTTLSTNQIAMLLQSVQNQTLPPSTHTQPSLNTNTPMPSTLGGGLPSVNALLQLLTQQPQQQPLQQLSHSSSAAQAVDINRIQEMLREHLARIQATSNKEKN